MTCRLDALRDKEVINVKDGGRVGFVGDAEVDVKEARLRALVVYGRLRLFGLLGREAGCGDPLEEHCPHRGGTRFLSSMRRRPRLPDRGLLQAAGKNWLVGPDFRRKNPVFPGIFP